jgi:hypothetical protein
MILAAYNTVPFSQGLRRSTDALFAKGAKPSEGVVVGPWSAVKVAGKHSEPRHCSLGVLEPSYERTASRRDSQRQ